MDGWQKDAKERRISVGRKQAGVLRESERGEQHFSVSSKTPAGKMLIISRCFLRVKMHAKNGRPLSRSIFIRCLFPLRLPYPCTLPIRRDAL